MGFKRTNLGDCPPEERIRKLREVIEYHRKLYLLYDKQEISEAALDSLKHELFELEQKYPELITPDSPTQRVGGEPLKKFKKIYHTQPILSIEDIFNFFELKDWEKYLRDFLKYQGQIFYFCERKIDGLDIVLTYKKGILSTGATRGNGLIGEDVTANIKTIEAIPLKLNSPVDVEVRGEIFMRKFDFEKLNKKQEKNGLPLFANPRNIAAGSIRQLDPKITASRKLDCFVFEILTDLGQKTHQEVHKILKDLGFKTDPETKLAKNLEEVEAFHQYQEKKRNMAPFWYDGIVVVVNDVNLEKQAGVVGKSPRWMRAYKFQAEQATTKIKDIILQVGRTGTITPVAILEPVMVMGSKVSRATLHNEDEIKRLDARIGDTVIVQKSGDVIPDIVKVIKELRTGKEKKFKMPNKCPVCGGEIKREKGGVAWRCLNKNCFAKNYQKLVYFASKKCFDIEHLGPKIIEQLIQSGLIKDGADIFSLTAGDLEPLERFAEKSANNLAESIKNSKKIILPCLITALSIPGVGEETAQDIAKFLKKQGVKTIDDLIKKGPEISKEEWQNIPNIGPVVAMSLFSWFKDKENILFLKKLKENGVKIEEEKIPQGKLPFLGLTFIFTGEMKNLTRQEAKEKVRLLGGNVSESISRKTNYLVVGENPGEKLAQAKKLKIKTISEQEFFDLLT